MCSGAGLGPSRNLSQDLANTFNVTVCAYNDEVWYYPDHENPQAPIRCSGNDPACLKGRNLTSIGRDEPDKPKKKGRGYFCQAKVPDAYAGAHMRDSVKISPRNIAEGKEDGDD